MKLGYSLSNRDFEQYSEHSAYTNSARFIKGIVVPANKGIYTPNNLLWPSDLIQFTTAK